MSRQELLDRVRNLLLTLNGQVDAYDDLSESASLIQDLGLDSFALESLFSSIRDEILDVEFTPWFVRASRRGEDTVASLVDYVMEQLHQQEAERRTLAA